MNYFGFSTIAAIAATIGVGQGQHSSWMSDMSANQSVYGYDLFDSTIFGIIWPGTADPGMYESAIDTSSGIIASGDDFAVLMENRNFPNASQILSWCSRQWGDVEGQLNYGSRFFQISFTEIDDEYYSYRGVTGATATEIATAMNTFLTANPNEFLIISLTDGSDDDLIDAFTDVLNANRFVDNTVDITSQTISDLQTENDDEARIIIFSDSHSGSSSKVFVSGSYLTSYNDTNAYTFSEVRTAAVNDLRLGWDVNTMFLLDWRVRIESSDDLNSYDGWFEYSRDINYGLSTSIGLYSKLRWGNVIMVDYFQTSDAIEQAIILNLNYHTCNDDDAYWGTGTDQCPYLSNLRNAYSSSGVQDACFEFSDGEGKVPQPWASSCLRSCGNCTYLTGVPGSTCNDTSDCDSAIYQADGKTGRCFVTDEEEDNFILEASMCMAIDTISACASTDEDDVCKEGNELDTSDCDEGCGSNFQCTSGYCSSTYGVCMAFNYSTATSQAPDTTQPSDIGYTQVKSETAAQFREDIEWLRPGDPDGNYSADFTDVSDPFALMDSNPYLTSIIGFILIPFVLAIFLFACWFCTCVFWCCPCCEGCCKKCCCRMCLGENPDENQVAKWTPCAILAATMIVIVWACIEGIIYNSSMHDHIFAAANSTAGPSVRSEINDLFSDVIDKLAGVEPIANGIIDDLSEIITDVVDSISNTSQLDKRIEETQEAIADLDQEYGRERSFNTTVEHPFTRTEITETIYCSYCEGIADSVEELNRTVSVTISEGVAQLQSAINSTKQIVDANASIYQAVDGFVTIISELVNSTRDIQDDADDAFESVKDIDEQREFGGFVFFTVPFVWIVFPILGLFLGTCLGKWCFKVNWCLAMFLGATVMLILSFFAVLTVGWADLCVRLDDFETELKNGDAGESDIGSQLSAGLGEDESQQLYDVLDVCFYGGSLLDIFNLTSALDFDQFREDAAESLDIDIASFFDSSELDSFQTELDLLDASTFSEDTDENLNALNALNRTKCFCPKNSSDFGVAFTRELILADECSEPRRLITVNNGSQTEKDVYWTRIINESNATELTSFDPTSALCKNYYVAVYSLVFAEDDLNGQTQMFIDGLKEAGNRVTAGFDGIYDYALGLEQILVDVTCSLNPLFDSFDIILDEYTSCVFIGDSYEGFKEVGCELLFSDMYHIARSMAMIAFLSIMIVYCSMCMDYVKDPMTGDEEDDDEFGNKAAVGSQTDPYSKNTEMGTMGGSRPSYAQGAGDTQPGQAEGGPGAANTQFV